MTTADDQNRVGTAATEVEVCVVGGGATALFAALLCARSGRSVLLVASEVESAGAGIAPLVAPPTLGLLAGEGIEEELLQGGQRILGVYDYGPAGLLAGWRYADFPGIARPYGLTVPTGTLVQALLARLRAESSASVWTGRRVAALDQDGDGVLLTFTSGADGAAEPDRVRARYAVAAEGRHSPLRDMTGITVRDALFGRPGWLVTAPVPPSREPVLVVRHLAPQALFTIPIPGSSLAVIPVDGAVSPGGFRATVRYGGLTLHPVYQPPAITGTPGLDRYHDRSVGSPHTAALPDARTGWAHSAPLRH